MSDAAAASTAADSSDNAVTSAVFPLPEASITTPGNLAAAQNSVSAHGTVPKAKLSNPYAELPGTKLKGTAAPLGRAVAAQPSTALLTPLLTSAQQQQQQHASSGRTAATGMATTGAHDANAAQDSLFAGPMPSSTDDLVTTYSSFSHDPVNPYAAFGAGPTISYTDSGSLIDNVNSSAPVVTTHDVPHGGGNQMSNNFDDMTELQL